MKPDEVATVATMATILSYLPSAPDFAFRQQLPPVLASWCFRMNRCPRGR